jgi:hypothetical protein
VRPAIELNVDASPDMSTWGLYLRLDAPVVGPLTAAEDPEVFLEGVLGAYGSVAAGHELHVALSGALGPLSDAEGDPGAVALGYNVLLTDTLELISEVSFGIPLSGEPFSVGVVVGLIASLPTGGDTEDPANPAN